MRIVELVDGALRRRGLAPGPVLLTARALILFAFVLSAAGVLLLPLTAWPFWLAVGVALSAGNFCGLTFFLAHFLTAAGGAPVPSEKLLRGQLFFFPLRLFITGFLLYLSLTVFHATPVALLIGLSAAVLAIMVLMLLRTPFS